MSKENDVSGAIRRAFLIFEILFNADEPLNIAEISERCNLPKTTIFRLLNTLLECGAITKDNDNNYSLGLLFALYGEKVKSETDIISIAKPLLTSLRNEIQETVNLGVLFDKKFVVNVFSLPGEAFILTSRTLPVAPLHCSAMGKLFLCDMPLQDVKAYFSSGYVKRTSKTIVTYEEFLSEKKLISTEKVSFDNEEYEYGLQCVAAPIYDYTGRIIASISITGPMTRLISKDIDHIVDRIKKTAEQISRVTVLSRLTSSNTWSGI